MSVSISSEVLATLVAAAQASPGLEVCGLLLGAPDRIQAMQTCANVAANPARAFEIDPAALFAAHRRARGGGPAVVGHYHSHPSGTLVPSPRDAEQAMGDGALWLILAGDAVRLWRSVDRGAFIAEPLVVQVCRDLRPGTGPVTTAACDERITMTVSPVDFASLLCSRLCHDLLSPVGALNNGLELLADETDPAMRERCMELLADSARASASKLKFFRLAFGAAGGFGEMVATDEARGAIEGLIAENKRIDLHWAVEEATMPKTAIKVLMNLALMASESLVRGGRMDIGGEDNEGHLEIVVKIEGGRIVLDPDIRRTLIEGEGVHDVTPRAAAAYMINTLVTEAGGTVLVSEPADGIMIFGAVFNGR